MFRRKESTRDRRGSSSPAHRSPRRLLLECLEDRVVPSIPDGTILVCTGPSSFSSQDQSSFPIGIIGVNPSTGAQFPVSTGGLFSKELQKARGIDGKAQFPVSTGGLFSLPTYISEAPNGQLYVTDFTAVDPTTGKQTGAVIQVDPNTGDQTVLATGGNINGPNVLAFVNGYIYVADVGDSSGVIHNIVQIDPNTGQQRLLPSGGDFIQIDPSTGQQRPITSEGGFTVATGIAPAPGNNIYVLDEPGNVQGSDPGAIWEVNLDTGKQTLLTHGGLLDHPVDIAVEANGDLIVGNTGSAANDYAGSVVQVNPQTGMQTPVSRFGADTALNSVTLDPNSGTIFVGAISYGTTPGMIYAVNPATGAQKPVTSGNLISCVDGIMVYRVIGPVAGGDPRFFSQDEISSPGDTTPPPEQSAPRLTLLEPAAVAAVLAVGSESQEKEQPAVDPMLRQMLTPAVSDLVELMSAALEPSTN